MKPGSLTVASTSPAASAEARMVAYDRGALAGELDQYGFAV